MNRLAWSAVALAVAVALASGARAQDRIRTDTLDAGSPTWNRPKHVDAVSPTCELAAEDATQDGESYAAFDIEVTAPENLEAAIVDEGTSDQLDPFLALYCAPFDPQQPLANLIATHDDQGPLAPLPIFTADRGIALAPGQTYTIVVTTFDPGDFGTFELALQSPTAHFVPEPDGGGCAAALAIGVLGWRRGRAIRRRP